MTYIKAVFFDLDGVLVDACEWHYEALKCSISI
jgi:beta-phosphoglucomutase-like phosphatase (HAD superfamily)